MAGKMTILDRLMKEGRIKPRLDETMWSHADFRDPLNYTFAGRQHIKAHPESFPRLDITPERQVYQRGINALIDARKRPIQEKYENVSGELEDVQNEFEEAFDEAKEGLVEDIRSDMDYFEAPEIRYGFDTGYRGDLTPDLPERSLEDYWPARFKGPGWYNDRGYELGDLMDEYRGRLDYMKSPEYRMELQHQSPRYRKYQRAMEARAANRRMGHQLSRMWGDAYNRLRARGLSDDEARTYLHNYFGGR